MVLRILLLIVASVAEDDEANFSCQLLQTGLRLSHARERRERNTTVSVANGVCKPVSSLKQEIYEPIANVTERLGEDGWCIFGGFGTWASNCAIARRTKDIMIFPKTFEDEYEKFMNAPQATPFALRFPDNRTLIIRDHFYPLDDAYCFLNGWYNLPRAELVNNFSYLEEMSDRYCDHLSKTFPGYWNISMADLLKESTSDEAFLADIQKNGADVGYATPSFVDGMYLHAAAKCLLRGGHRGAVCDLANCASRACFGASPSELLYTARGECEKLTK